MSKSTVHNHLSTLRSSVWERPVVQTQSRTAAGLLIPPALVLRPVLGRHEPVPH